MTCEFCGHGPGIKGEHLHVYPGIDGHVHFEQVDTGAHLVIHSTRLESLIVYLAEYALAEIPEKEGKVWNGTKWVDAFKGASTAIN